MKKPKNKQHLSGFDPSKPDSLRGLDEDAFIGLVTRLYEQNRQLSELLQAFLQEKYGPKTERFVDPEQLNLFENVEEALPAEQAADTNDGQADSADTQKKRSSRDCNPKPSNVPHVKIPARKLSPAELICVCCGQSLVKVNEIIIHSRFDYKPSSVRIEDIVEDVLACPGCQGDLVAAADSTGLFAPESESHSLDSTATTIAAELAHLIDSTNGAHSSESTQTPAELLDSTVDEVLSGTRLAAAKIARCHASAGMLSYVAISKYCDHLPLYRLTQMFARDEANIPRSTMCGWLNLVADLLRGLYEFMRLKLLDSSIIWTDDTPVKVQDKKARKKIKLGRIWVYIGDNDHPFNLFHYTQGRCREGPKTFLKKYKKYLQGDCFSGNLAICAENGATFVACNAHARRYFKKALLNYKTKSEEALHLFGQLFEIERTAKELQLKSDDVKLMREQESNPILDNLKVWLDKEQLLALPKSAFGTAVNYCLNNWNGLTAYLQDGDLTIDNNAAEREMKRVATGRKAWLFFGSDNGGENAEVLLSIISTCKRHGVEPFTYLRDVIERLVHNPDIDLETLLPHTWNQKQSALS
jgi:transposase